MMIFYLFGCAFVCVWECLHEHSIAYDIIESFPIALTWKCGIIIGTKKFTKIQNIPYGIHKYGPNEDTEKQ